MARKDIWKDGDYMPTRVGPNLYVWSKGGLRPTGDRGCVITSHGIDITLNHQVQAGHPKPQVDLYFYCPHGYSLPDNQVEGVMTRRTKWYEKVGPGVAEHDYVLTKAQGYHSALDGHETYGHLQKGFHPTGRRERAKEGYMITMENQMNVRDPAARISGVRAAQAQYKEEMARLSDVVLDVVTVRNRLGLFAREVTLFSTIELLEKHGFHYNEVHCNFCRGPHPGHRMEENLGSWRAPSGRDLDAIVASRPEARQTLLFSATLAPRISRIAGKYLSDPVEVRISDEPEQDGDGPLIEQRAYLVRWPHKLAALGRVLDMESPEPVLVFRRTRNDVDELLEALNARGYRAEAMQGGMSQDERERMMKKLRGGQVDPLVATDVAARGLDISHLTHVVKLRPTLRAGALRPSAPRLSRTAVTTTRSAGGESTS